MATMNVSLPHPMKDWVESRTKNGRYSNVSDCVRVLIRRDQFRQQAIEEMQGVIEDGLNSGEARSFDMSAYLLDKTAGAG